MSVLQGLQAVTKEAKITLPTGAQEYIEVEGQMSECSDFPVLVPSSLASICGFEEGKEGALMAIGEFLEKLSWMA